MKRPEIERALDAADPKIRCYLLYGPDESGSRALSARLGKAMGADAERIDIAPATLKADPARLADEAASTSLFGGARWIRVEGAGEESLAAVAALLDAAAAGNPVVLIGGALKKDAKLVRLIEGNPAAVGFLSRAPEGEEAARIATTIAREAGLRIDADLGRRLADASGGDRAILAGEIAKLALYVDATPEAAREATHADYDAIGADAGEADTAKLLDALFGGDEAGLAHELSHAAADGSDGITMVRAVLRRLLPMVAARAVMEGGASAPAAIDVAARHLFWRDKEVMARDLPRWSAIRLAAAVDRMSAMERTLKSSRGPGPIAANELLHAMARSARRR